LFSDAVRHAYTPLVNQLGDKLKIRLQRRLRGRARAIIADAETVLDAFRNLHHSAFSIPYDRNFSKFSRLPADTISNRRVVETQDSFTVILTRSFETLDILQAHLEYLTSNQTIARNLYVHEKFSRNLDQ
jgi:hypothetical protein